MASHRSLRLKQRLGAIRKEPIVCKHTTSSPGRFSLALEVGHKAREKRPGDEVGKHCLVQVGRQEAKLSFKELIFVQKVPL